MTPIIFQSKTEEGTYDSFLWIGCPKNKLSYLNKKYEMFKGSIQMGFLAQPDNFGEMLMIYVRINSE
jgi:hypothetical protein